MLFKTKLILLKRSMFFFDKIKKKNIEKSNFYFPNIKL